MRLENYKYQDDAGWEFSEVHTRRVNLFVGATGSGKSRLLNTISSIGEFVSSGTLFKAGKWLVRFRDADRCFEWALTSTDNHKGDKTIGHEQLVVIPDDGMATTIYERTGPTFSYESKTLPRLSHNTPGLFLFREENIVAPVFHWFTQIRRRNFFGSELERSCEIQSIPQNIEPVKKIPIGGVVLELPLSLNVRLHLLKRFQSEKFFELMNLYKDIFPSIEQCDVMDATELKRPLPTPDKGKTPLFFVKERLVKEPILLHELSSGMQKVLLIMTDVLTLQKDATYLIDEYENSLGVNAIGFLPELLTAYAEDNQFFITSHHPYLINNIPVVDWHIFHRQGGRVTIRGGEEFAEKFSTSKQAAFTQLINDPFYTQGIE